MTARPPDNSDRLFELLADRTVGALTAEDRAELDRLLAAHPEFADADPISDAAGEFIAGSVPDTRPEWTDQARERLEFLGAAVAAKHASGRGPASMRISDAQPGAQAAQRTTRRSARPAWSGWIAAAAALAFAFAGWYPRLAGRQEGMTLAQLMQDPGTVVTPLNPTDNAAATGVGGKVYWNEGQQKGYVVLSDFPQNDPTINQYQLWIFDKKRDANYPVDGGVFNVAYRPGDTARQVVIPIDAKLYVADPALYAITKERPHGVVVTDRKELLVTGDPASKPK